MAGVADDPRVAQRANQCARPLCRRRVAAYSDQGRVVHGSWRRPPHPNPRGPRVARPAGPRPRRARHAATRIGGRSSCVPTSREAPFAPFAPPRRMRLRGSPAGPRSPSHAPDGVLHRPSTVVENSWILREMRPMTWWTTRLCARSGHPYRRSCPKGPSGTGDTEITSRTSAPRRSLRAFRRPGPTASAAPARLATARRSVTGIPVSVRPSGPFSKRASDAVFPWTSFRRPARP